MTISYKCSPLIELTEIDQEWLVLHTGQFTVTKVNEVGAFILRALMEQKNMDDIVRLLQLNYEVDASLAKADLLAFLEELKGAGIVHEEC